MPRLALLANLAATGASAIGSEWARQRWLRQLFGELAYEEDKFFAAAWMLTVGEITEEEYAALIG